MANGTPRRTASPGSLSAFLGTPTPADVRNQTRREKVRIAALQLALERTPIDAPNRPELEAQFGQLLGNATIGMSFRPEPAEAEQFTLGRTRFEKLPGQAARRIAQVQEPSTAGERRRRNLIDLRVRQGSGETLSLRDRLTLEELEKEQERATVITGRTPEDVAVKDPVRRRKLKTFISKNADLKKELSGLVESIQEFPAAVGGIAGGRERVGGIVGQFGDLFEKESLNALAKRISPDELTAIRTKAAGLRTALLPIFTGDESRYTDRDMQIVTENLKVLETTASAQQALTALSNIATIVSARDADARSELLEGFNQTFLGENDIQSGGFKPGVRYQDAQGNSAIYTGTNPQNPLDPANWKEQ